MFHIKRMDVKILEKLAFILLFVSFFLFGSTLVVQFFYSILSSIMPNKQGAFSTANDIYHIVLLLLFLISPMIIKMINGNTQPTGFSKFLDDYGLLLTSLIVIVYSFVQMQIFCSERPTECT